MRLMTTVPLRYKSNKGYNFTSDDFTNIKSGTLPSCLFGQQVVLYDTQKDRLYIIDNDHELTALREMLPDAFPIERGGAAEDEEAGAGAGAGAGEHSLLIPQEDRFQWRVTDDEAVVNYQPTETDYKKIAKQYLSSGGHLLAEGLAKTFGWTTVIALLFGKQYINWETVAPISGSLSLFGGFPNQRNYVTFSQGGLPKPRKGPDGFEAELLRDGYVLAGADGERQYETKKRDFQFALRLLLINTLIEMGDGAAVMLALKCPETNPCDWGGKAGWGLFGLLGGLIKAYQNDLLVVVNGWEFYAAHIAETEHRLVPPIETLLPFIKYRQKEIVSFLSTFTPILFGGLHVFAIHETELIHHNIASVIGAAPAAWLSYLTAYLVWEGAAAGTLNLDIFMLFQKVGIERPLSEYPLASRADQYWRDKIRPRFRIRSAEASGAGEGDGEAVVDEAETAIAVIKPEPPHNFIEQVWRAIQNYTKFFGDHPVEAIARQLYGQAFEDVINKLLPKAISTIVMTGSYGLGLFFLFFKSISTVLTETISPLAGVEDIMMLGEGGPWYEDPKWFVAVAALYAALGQAFQKRGAFQRRWDETHEEGAFDTLGEGGEEEGYHEIESSGSEEEFFIVEMEEAAAAEEGSVQQQRSWRCNIM